MEDGCTSLDALLRLIADRLPGDLLPVTVAESLTRQPGRGMSAHSHADETQIELITGSGRCRVDDRPFDYHKGLLLLIPPGMKHGFDYGSGRPTRHLTIKFRCVAGALRNLPLVAIPFTAGGFHERIGGQLRAMVEEWQLRPRGFSEALSVRLAAVLIDILRFQDADQGEEHDGLLDAACRFMAVHYGRQLSVAQVAKHCGLRADSLCRLFRRRLATTPGRYLLDLRLRHAQMLLRSGYNVTESAERCGFASIHHFSRTFSRHFNSSPTAWVAAGSLT
jgi:AraC-like DNA-binding protein